MKLKIGILLVLGFYLSLGTAIAQTCSSTERSTTLFFSNGIRTPSEKTALKKLNLIQEKLHARLIETSSAINEACISYGVAFNHSSSTFQDLIESIGQIQNADWSDFWGAFFGPSTLSQQFYDIVVRNIEQTPLESYVEKCDLNVGICDLVEQVYEYRNTLKKGRVIVVGHSQGNLFANEAFSGLSALGVFQESRLDDFRAVGIATPASFVANERTFTADVDETYTSLIEDNVSNLVFYFANSGRLVPHTANNPFPCLWPRDFGCHDFDNYMKGRTSGLKIVDSIIQRLPISIPSPPVSSLLLNGSFESGPFAGSFVNLSGGTTSIPGWTVTGEGIDYIGTIWTASNGTHSLDLDGSIGSVITPPYVQGGIAQTFATTPGISYLATFDLAGNPDNLPIIKPMRVLAAGTFMDFTFDITGKSLGNMGWLPQSWTFTATNTSTTLEFRSLTVSPLTGWGPALDNVAVRPITAGP